MDDDALIKELIRYQATPKEILQNQELLSFVLPEVRRDYKLNESFIYRGECINSPLILHSGVNDIHPKDMEVCYRAAKKNHVLFQMGDLYPNLIEVKNFIKCARYLNKKENPLYLRASFSPQVSYPAIDIISRIVPSIHTWKIKSITKELGPFDILMGEIGKTPIFIEYHNQVDPRDPDNYMHLLHSFTLFYSTGKLVLEDTFGPVLWKPRMHVPKKLYTPEEEPEYPPYMLENSIENIGSFRKRSYKDIITGEWPVAISKDLLRLKDMILNEKNGRIEVIVFR